MASKRPPIEVAELTQNLKDSTGRGLAAFFPSSAPLEQTQGVPPPVPPGVRVPVPVPPDQRLVPKTRRKIKERQPFDVFEDQYLLLKKISDAERNYVNGRGMNFMVREALDD